MKESGLKSDPNEPNGPNIDAKIDEIKNQLRRTETAKIKAEARLECLHADGVKVKEFLQDAECLVTLGLMVIESYHHLRSFFTLSKIRMASITIGSGFYFGNFRWMRSTRVLRLKVCDRNLCKIRIW
ncbi:uncharacterized protein LOC124340471 isoform X2 [Daphnia pulicaria]|uniref:uncharacterized protein LOC124340471 isoform X2 n=1 Tax=Daphnia pulicaria TaxID=35523 RepID=UPI001EEBB0F8|nr:uncharacterized protein LOC124340471 isoform X2 [Daphnia pulicaria]